MQIMVYTTIYDKNNVIRTAHIKNGITYRKCAHFSLKVLVGIKHIRIIRKYLKVTALAAADIFKKKRRKNKKGENKKQKN
jgi:hypothetical protein